MSNMVRDPAALRHRAAENWPPWQARRAAVLPRLPTRLAWSPLARLGRLSHPLPMRAGVAALVVVPFCAVARPFTGAGPLQQSLAALILALVVSIAQLLVDRQVAGPSDTVVLTRRASSDCGESPPMKAMPVATPPCLELASGKAFDDAVRRALTHLCDPTRLSLSPLLQLALVAAGLREQGLEDTRLQRVGVLKGLLADLVRDLRPAQRVDGCTGAACRFYNCLYYPYVRGVTRRRAPAVLRDLRERREREGGPPSEQERVLEWLLQVDEDTYYKWQRRASDTIALILREREGLLGGVVPAEGRRAVLA